MGERDFIDSILAQVTAKVRADAERVGQMTLGSLIDGLADLDGAMPIVIDRFDSAPGEFGSYRGYYEQIAFEPSGEFGTVAEFSKAAHAANGSTMEGYKGGDYIMHRDTMVWCSSYGLCSGLRLLMLTVVDGRAVLVTQSEDDEAPHV